MKIIWWRWSDSLVTLSPAPTKTKKCSSAPAGKNKKPSTFCVYTSFCSRVCQDLAVSQFAESGNPLTRRTISRRRADRRMGFCQRENEREHNIAPNFLNESRDRRKAYHNSCQSRDSHCYLPTRSETSTWRKRERRRFSVYMQMYKYICGLLSKLYLHWGSVRIQIELCVSAIDVCSKSRK